MIPKTEREINAQFYSTTRLWLRSIREVRNATKLGTRDTMMEKRTVLGGAIGILLAVNTEAFSLGATSTGGGAIRQNQSIRYSQQSLSQRQNSRLVLNGFFDNVFGGGDSSDSDLEEGVLSMISVGDFDEDTLQVRYDSLSDYITDKWMNLFETKSIKLTTPVQVVKRYEGAEKDDSISESASCKLVFQKVDTGYGDKDDEEDEDRQSKQDDEPKQGGVEIEVQQLASNSLRVVARRCDIDEDTMIKEMSEELILKELQKAISVWKKETL